MSTAINPNDRDKNYKDMGFEKDLFGNSVDEPVDNVDKKENNHNRQNDSVYENHHYQESYPVESETEEEEGSVSDETSEQESLFDTIKKANVETSQSTENNEYLEDFYREEPYQNNKMKNDNNNYYYGHNKENKTESNSQFNNTYINNTQNREYNKSEPKGDYYEQNSSHQQFSPHQRQHFQSNYQPYQFTQPGIHTNPARYLDSHGQAVSSKGKFSNWPSFMIDNTSQNIYSFITIIATFFTLFVGLLMSGYYLFGLDDSYNKTGFGKFINWICFGFSALIVGLMGLFVIVLPLFFIAAVLSDPSSVSTVSETYPAIVDLFNFIVIR